MIDIENSNILKKRFVKDFDIPISVFKEPIFTNRINLFDTLFESKSKWERFVQEVNQFKSEQDYLEYYNHIKDVIIDHIKNKPEYQEFITYDYNKYKVNNYGIGDHGVFVPKNHNRTLLSFDLKKANFQALKFFSSNLVDNLNTYEEFISQFTNLNHIIKSKYIRQVIFGTCNPKRQVTIEKYLMSGIMDLLIGCSKEMPIKILTYMHDEIVVDVTDSTELMLNILKSTVNNFIETENIEVKSEIYQVYNIPETEFYIQYFNDGTYKFKGLSSLFYPIVIKQMNKLTVENEDLTFYHEGYLSRFIDIPQFKSKDKG